MRAVATLALVLGGLLVLAGCLEALNPPPKRPTTVQGTEQDAFRTLERGAYSGITTPTSVVVTNETAYRELWARHTGDPQQQPPAVNFGVDRVVAIFAGNQPDSCREARVINASTDPSTGETTVRWNLTAPAPETACASVVTQPYVVVALKHRDTTVKIVGPTAPGNDSSSAQARRITPAFKEYMERRYARFTDARSFAAALQPGTSIPQVDFTREMVVAAFHGPAANLCYGVDLGTVTPRGNHTEIEVVYRGPTEDQACAEAYGWPTLALVIPKTDAISIRETYRNAAPAAPHTPQEVGPAKLLLTDEAKGIPERKVEIVDNNARWQALWAAAHPDTDGTAPNVDFTRHRVVASFLGANTTCVAATGIGAVHAPEPGQLVLDILVWMAPPGIQCIRQASHGAAYSTIPIDGTVTTRDLYVNPLPA